MENDIVPSIITAVAALSGVAVSQLGDIVRSLFDKNKERTALLRSKLEELADNLHRTTEWFDWLAKTASEKGDRQVTSSGGPISVATSSEARRVYVLSLLYFPSMREEARTLLNSSYEFYLLVQSLDNLDSQKLNEITSKYRAAKKALDDLIALKATKLT